MAFGIFNAGGQDEDIANPPPSFGVGAMGGNLRQMNPRMLMQLLQAKMQQKEQQKKLMMQQSFMANKRQNEEALISQLPPDEQQEARIFGLKYVAERRKAREGYVASDERARLGREAAGARAGDKRDFEQRRAQLLLDQVMGRPGKAGVGPDQFTGDAEALGQEQAGGYGAAMAIADPVQRAMMAQQQMAAVAKKAQEAMIPPAPVNVIEPWEESALSRAGVPIPKELTTRKDYENSKKAYASEVKNKKKEDAEAEAQAEFQKFLEEGGNNEEVSMADTLVRNGMKPAAAIVKVTSLRDKKRKEEVAENEKKRKEEKADKGKSHAETNKLLSEIAKLEKENLGEVPEKGPIGIPSGKMKKKLSKEQRDINQAEIDRKRARLKEIEGGGNAREEELLKKFDGGEKLTDEERKELDGYLGIGDQTANDPGYMSIDQWESMILPTKGA